MEGGLTGKIRNSALIPTLVASITLATVFSGRPVLADDIVKGTRGPTNWQLDERVTYSKNEKNVKTLTNNLIMKYWDGDKFGKWIFINVPYKYIHSSEGEKNGLGDFFIGGGPRGTIGNLHWLSYLGLSLPTGRWNGKIPTGNGRYDTKIGVMTTYFGFDKKFEVDGVVEYNLTGKNKKGINPPTELYAGGLVATEIAKNTRLGVGLTYLRKENNDYSSYLKAIVRHDLSRKFHIQVGIEKCIGNKGIAKDAKVGLTIRSNL